MSKKKRTPGYIIFYILFLPDSWQILIGIVAAYLLFPFIVSAGMGLGANVMLYIMLAAIGYAGSKVPARWITRILKKWILGDRIP